MTTMMETGSPDVTQDDAIRRKESNPMADAGPANEIESRSRNDWEEVEHNEVSRSPMRYEGSQDQEEILMEELTGEDDCVPADDDSQIVDKEGMGHLMGGDVRDVRGHDDIGGAEEVASKGEAGNKIKMEDELSDEVGEVTSTAVLPEREREEEDYLYSSRAPALGETLLNNNCNQRNGNVAAISTVTVIENRKLVIEEGTEADEKILSSDSNPAEVRRKDDSGESDGSSETNGEVVHSTIQDVAEGNENITDSNKCDGQPQCTEEQVASETNKKRKLDKSTFSQNSQAPQSNSGDAPNPLINFQDVSKKFPTTYYPSISLTRLRTLKWAHCRDLMMPFLSDSQKENIHKKTRAELSEMLEKKVVVGLITPERFWDVVGLDKVRSKTGDGGGGVKGAKCNNFNNSTFPTTTLPTHPAPTLPPGMPPHSSARPYLYPPPRTIVMGHAHGPLPPPRYHAGQPPPHPHPPPHLPQQPPKLLPIPPPSSVETVHLKYSQPQAQHQPSNNQVTTRNTFKYSLHAPFFWATNHVGYPAGVLLGEPNPQPQDNTPINTSPTNKTTSPPSTNSQTISTVQGIFHSSGIPPVPTGLDHFLAIKKDAGRGKCKNNTTIIPEVEEDLNVKKQCHLLFSKLEILLNLLCCKISDVFWVNLQVVDVHLHGTEVLDIFREYFNGGKKATDDLKSGGVALNLVGVAGLLHEGALVQMEFRAVVRRGPISLFVLEKSGVPLMTV